MWIHQFIQSLMSASARRRSPRRPTATQPSFEPLENRLLLAFSPLGEYGVGLNPEGLVAADFNGDGRLDLATNSVGLGIGVLQGNGDATFQPAQYSGNGSGRPVLARDLNGDGRIDLMTINDSARDLRVLLGNGDGTFQPPSQSLILPSQFPPGTPNVHPHQTPISVAVEDLNADGNLDLVVAGYEEEEIVFWEVYRQHDYANVLLGNGDGTFGPNTAYHVASTDNTPFKPSVLAVGDFAGDGNPDVLMSDQGRQIVLVGNGDGTLQTPPQPNWFEYQGAGEDVNADGILDTIALLGTVIWYSDSEARTTRTARVQLGNSDGSFAPPVVSALGTVEAASYFGSRVLADFEGDGFPDLAVVERRFTAGVPIAVVSVARNDGNWSPPSAVVPSISISDVTLTEGNTGTRAATFTMTLSAAHSLPVTVAYATANGSAAAVSDYLATSGTLTFAPGETTMTASVPVLSDTLLEPNETFLLNLSNPTNATIADGQGVGTIIDDEPVRPVLTIDDVTRTEGNSRTTAFVFTVSLSSTHTTPVTVKLATANGTATTGNKDYKAKSSTLTFAPGETSKTFTVLVNGDRRSEPDETFFVNLKDPINADIADGQGVGTILNDEPTASTAKVAKAEVKKGQKSRFASTVTLAALLTQLDDGGGPKRAAKPRAASDADHVSLLDRLKPTADRRNGIWNLLRLGEAETLVNETTTMQKSR